MPPSSTGHVLSSAQVDVLRRWVSEGGEYADHWSFRPVVRPEPPAVSDTTWPRNPIDFFVLARLEQDGWSPSPEAAPTTLCRRLHLDLTGLPPTPEEVAAFLQSGGASEQATEREKAYAALVDKLLASPHFGERWGRHWLDIAHYADSDGYLGDAFRTYAWLYRDWVIDAVNRDLSFDQFTIEQLAGDLLPDATLAQKTATGFLRNTLRNTEAGVDLEEYRLKEIVDRVSTVGIGWLGLSVACAECHSHKYDPISQREFYQLFAFFNNADDVDLPAPRPGEIESYQAKLKPWTQREADLSAALSTILAGESLAVDSERLKTVLAALASPAKKRSREQRIMLDDLRRRAGEPLRKLCDDYEKHAAARPQPPATKVMTVASRSSERPTHVHLRGNYRNPGERVSPGTLAVLPPLEPRGPQADRLDLARWLVDPANPLSPRVTVNHLWKHLFGRGLVATVDNFGAGGDAPSHPDLLDWLAAELPARRWSRKAMIRLIVTSSTYRQASHVRPELEQRDPLNVRLARQSRFRLEAEIVRDLALAASGLLEPKIGGPGIRPPQPAYVASISRNVDWKVTTGRDLYRRGMYVVFRRATPYPMLLTFDAPDSTVACTRRERTNSPLQALTLLNDPVFFQCAQALGARLAAGPARSNEERVREAFQRCLGREPRSEETARLLALLEEERTRLTADPDAARSLAGLTQATSAAPVEQAAWTVLARVLMNLDEFITRE